MTRWINLGICDKKNCFSQAEWFTIENDNVKEQLCNNHFPPEKEVV